MSSDRQSDRRGHQPDGFAEFTEELRLLAEVLLARVEPVLRRTAADGEADLGGCAWCPVCAAAALVRGDHHDVVAALAEHGTSMVTVLREALAGVPVEPVLPPEWADHAAGHPRSAHDPGASHFGAGRDHEARPHREDAGRPDPTRDHSPHRAGAADRAQRTAAAADRTAPGRSGRTTATDPGAAAAGRPTRTDPARPGPATAGRASHSAGNSTAPGQPTDRGTSAQQPGSPTDDRGGATPETAPTDAPGTSGTRRPRWGAGRRDQSAPRPRRVDEHPATRAAQPPHIAPDTTDDSTSATGVFADDEPPVADDSTQRRPAADRAPRSGYVDIPVTIRG